MAFKMTSTYKFTGNDTVTLNVLTNVAPPAVPKTLKDLSKLNYPAGETNDRNLRPNADNQLVFMNQPMSWWVSNLKSESVHYLPYSNFVNWGYKDASGDEYHIDISLSNLLIPNKTKDVSKDVSSNLFTITFEEKLGMSRVDTRTM